MTATLIVAALVAGVYAALIAVHIGRFGRGDAAATWRAHARERRRGRLESDAVRRRVTGSLDRAGYHGAMAALAAQDAAEHPLEVPKSLL